MPEPQKRKSLLPQLGSQTYRPSETRNAKLKRLYEDPDSFATPLLVASWDLFGPELQEMDPEAIRLEIRIETGAEIVPENLSQLMAALTLLMDDSFYTSLPMFIQICNTLSGFVEDPLVFDLADAYDVAWGINEALLISPPENPQKPFSDEIMAYIRAVTKDAAVTYPVDVLSIAFPEHEFPDPAFGLVDNPEMYQAVRQAREETSSDLEQWLRQQWMLLFQQLAELPIENGNKAETFLRRIRHVVERPAQPDASGTADASEGRR
jgi:hypothetical protein